MQTRFVFKILAAVVAVAILILSLIPKPPPMPVQALSADKIGHFIAYVILSLLLFLATAANLRLKIMVLITLSCSFYGGIIEILQSLAGRTPEVADLVFDVIGSICGTIIAIIVFKHMPLRQEK